MRVNIPYNPSELIQLAQNVLAKHAADGAASLLNNLDMAALQAKTNIAVAQHALFEKADSDKKKTFQNRDIALGGRREKLTAGTVRFYVTSVRDILLGIYKGNERQLGDWGFEVNADLSVVIPENATELIALAGNILAKHAADGAGSPLTNINMADMQTKTNTAGANNTLAEELSRDKEKAAEIRDIALGHADKQDAYTAGTVQFVLCSVRDVLLGTFRGRERQLGDWGFGVAASTVPPTPPPPPTVAIRAVSDQVPPFLPITIEIAGETAGKTGNIAWGDGATSPVTHETGFTNYTHVYTSPGNKVIEGTGNLDNIREFQAMTCSLTELELPDIMRLITFRMSNNQLTTPVLPDAVLVNLRYVFLDSNNLTEQFVNNFLIRMNTLNTATGSRQIFLNDGTNAAPTGQGLAAKQQLIAKGWQVVTN